jgi:hypothetical protein
MSDSGIHFIDPPVPNERLLAYEISGDFTGDDMRTFVERLAKIVLIAESKWLEVYVGLVDHLTPQQVKYFDSSQKDEAFAWLTGEESAQP